MAKVLGIGGVFFKAADTGAVRDWYQKVLGLEFKEWGSAEFAPPDRGYSVFAPFEASTDYFGPSEKPFMINLMVDDLEGVLERAKRCGVEPLGRQDEVYGRFAWLIDPEGIKVELWEPARS